MLTGTAGLGERRSRGHYLDSLAMVALADGDVAAADGYLAEAGDIAAAIDEPRLGAAVAVHQALAHLARGDLAAARQVAVAVAPGSGTAGAAPGGPAPVPGGPAPEPDGSLLALERRAVTACVALAGGDRDTAARQATEMERRAAANGFALEARAARRIAAAAAGEDAADEAAAGESATDEAGTRGAPAAARYPRLIWVSGEAPAPELPVRGATLSRS